MVAAGLLVAARLHSRQAVRERATAGSEARQASANQVGFSTPWPVMVSHGPQPIRVASGRSLGAQHVLGAHPGVKL